MTLALIVASLICLFVPAALISALYYNDREARRAELGL